MTKNNEHRYSCINDNDLYCTDIVTKISEAYFEVTSIYLEECYPEYKDMISRLYKSTCMIISCIEE